MARTYKPLVELHRLDYSPISNPLIEPTEIKTKTKLVRATRGQDLIDANTGERGTIAAIYQTKEVDEEEFVKVFQQGVTAAYELTKTAQRVFQLVLEQYQRTPMSSGFADSVELFWFGEGLEGRQANMSEYTFNRGLRELIDKRFLSPKTPSSYWVNPALFFKGNRVAFIKEYKRKNKNSSLTLES